MTQNKLLLGSGGTHWPDWTTCDASPNSHADIIAMIPPLPVQVRDRKWDVIMAIHMIEHIPPWKAADLMRECYECLSPGGSLILEQPNILYAAQVLLGLVVPPAGEPGQFDMWPLYGDPNHRDELMLHRWGWQPDTLSRALAAAGFTNIAIETAQYHQPVRDFRVVGTKE